MLENCFISLKRIDKNEQLTPEERRKALAWCITPIFNLKGSEPNIPPKYSAKVCKMKEIKTLKHFRTTTTFWIVFDLAP
jgi:hypothetical protein